MAAQIAAAILVYCASVGKLCRNDINQFGKKGQGDRWLLDEKFLHHTASMNCVAGLYSRVMISGINSDLPCQIVGQLLRTFMTRQQANTFLSLTVLA